MENNSWVYQCHCCHPSHHCTIIQSRKYLRSIIFYVMYFCWSRRPQKYSNCWIYGNDITNLACLNHPIFWGRRILIVKYCLIIFSLSATDGRGNSTISSRRSLMAKSNWWGWLLANTNMNLSMEKTSLGTELLNDGHIHHGWPTIKNPNTFHIKKITWC